MYLYTKTSRISERKGKTYFLAASAILSVWVTNSVILSLESLDLLIHEANIL
jgi:hypothetical protein